MVDIQRVRIAWSGGKGGPGVSTFYCHDAAAALPELKGLMVAIASVVPVGVTFTYPTAGDIIDVLSGQLSGAWTAAGRAADNSAGTGSYALPVGMMIRWETGSVVNGHRLRGRTFVVPCVSTVFDNEGTVTPTALSELQVAVTSKVATLANNLLIYSRPKPARTTKAGVVIAARAGAFADVTSGVVPDKAMVLRSRRD
jgi:hypothetical protein